MVLSIQPRSAFKYQAQTDPVGRHLGQCYDSTFISKTCNMHQLYNLLNYQVQDLHIQKKLTYQASLCMIVPQVL